MKRIIPCLDVRDAKTVKGVNFIDIKVIGEPLDLAQKYDREGADELVMLDIGSKPESRPVFLDLVHQITQAIQIPLTVGGGITSVNDAQLIFDAGASKVSINSAAVKNPQLIRDLVEKYGSGSIVVAIDTKFENDEWIVIIGGGNIATELKTIEWAKEVQQLGAGEILLTSMSNDGMKSGFAGDITRAVAETVSIPVIASGGAGSVQDFVDILKDSKVDAALAAGIFHYDEVKIAAIKEQLQAEGIAVRI